MGRIFTIKLGQLERHEFTDKNVESDTVEYFGKTSNNTPKIVKSFIRHFGVEEKVKSWVKLKESLEKGYQPTKYGYIKVVKYWRKNKYYVYDGNHRVTLLKQMYGSEYGVLVQRTNLLSLVPVLFIVLIVSPLIMIKRKIYGI
jgi:uncharacterized protein (DUF1015 family)